MKSSLENAQTPCEMLFCSKAQPRPTALSEILKLDMKRPSEEGGDARPAIHIVLA
jgi:hypothetical protein